MKHPFLGVNFSVYVRSKLSPCDISCINQGSPQIAQISVPDLEHQDVVSNWSHFDIQARYQASISEANTTKVPIVSHLIPGKKDNQL